jgi:hypothetical protein
MHDPHRMWPTQLIRSEVQPEPYLADLPDHPCRGRATGRRNRPIRWRSTECPPIFLSS